MTVDIVGCGATGQNWEKHDYSIGVNDCFKWGKKVDALLLCNFTTRFTHDRFQTIIHTPTDKLYTNFKEWSQWFPNLTILKLVPWYGTLRSNTFYYVNTGPFIAMTIAYSLGAKEIILWGVDFIDHHVFHSTNPETKREVERYLELIQCLNEQGVKVFVGCEGSVFDGKLKVYQNEKVL